MTSRELNDLRVINAIPAHIWRSAPDGTVQFVNQQWMNYTGLSQENSQGWGWVSVIHGDDRPKLLDTWRRVTFVLSGEIDSDHVTELEALMAAVSNRLVVLDLVDVTVVNRGAIGFLAGVEAAGATLVNCPDYVRSWIDAEQGDA